MIKRSVAAILVLLYCMSAVGMPLHLHYCKGELKHVTLLLPFGCSEESHTDVHACCKKMQQPVCEDQDGCCDDETTWLQDDLLAQCVKTISFESVFPLPQQSHLAIEVPELVRQSGMRVVDLIPNDLGPPLFVRHCAFMFYG